MEAIDGVKKQRKASMKGGARQRRVRAKKRLEDSLILLEKDIEEKEVEVVVLEKEAAKAKKMNLSDKKYIDKIDVIKDCLNSRYHNKKRMEKEIEILKTRI